MSRWPLLSCVATLSACAGTAAQAPELDAAADVANCEVASGFDASVPAGYAPAHAMLSAACVPGTDLTGRYFRFDHFSVDEPSGPDGALAATLTALWNGQIARGELNIIYHVVSHDPATGVLRVEGGTAVRLQEGPDKGRLAMPSDPPPEVLDLRLDGCAFRSGSLGLLRVFPDLLTRPIDIGRLFTQGAFDADGGRITGGYIEGGICTSMAVAQYFKLSPGAGCLNFYQFTRDLGVLPDRDDLPCGGCDASGYTFKGSFDATLVPDMLDGRFQVPRLFTCD